jgi:hypothetical protein
MTMHPHISSQLASDRQNEMLARAQSQRLARQLRAGSKPAQQPTRRLSQPLRAVARLLTAFQA